MLFRSSKEEVEKNLDDGLPFVIRQNNPTDGKTSFHDELYGDVEIDNSELTWALMPAPPLPRWQS